VCRPNLLEEGSDTGGKICSAIAERNFGPNKNIQCECTFVPLRGEVGLRCIRDEPLCTPGNKLCGYPSWEGEFSLIRGAALVSKFCYECITCPGLDDPSLGGFLLPCAVGSNDICFEFVLSKLHHICKKEGKGLFHCLKELLHKKDDDSYDGKDQGHRKVDKTKVSLGGKKCNSSNSCDGIFGGCNFDCSNIVPGFKFDTCPLFDILENYREKHQRTGVWPELFLGEDENKIIL
jgi:hypothetical protein